MVFRASQLATCAAIAIVAMLTAAPAAEIDSSRLQAAEQNPADWLTYHGGYKSYHYSALDQINAGNVKNLQVAWTHLPGRSTRGLQAMPLVADGVLYYSGSYSRVFALDGATGKLVWSYFPELDEDLISMQTHSPYNRGVALGHGKVYVGTVDGRLIALDIKTGKPVWDTKLVNSQKLTVGFTGAPLVVKDTVIIGSQGGEWTSRGPLFGVDANTGQKKWEFFTVAGTDEAKQTWGGDSWRTGGGGAWMPGTYDAERLGLRLGGRRIPADRPRREEAGRPPQQGRLHLRLRPQQRQGAERLAANEEHQLRERHRSQDRRAHRAARSLGRRGETAAVPGHCRRGELERGRL